MKVFFAPRSWLSMKTTHKMKAIKRNPKTRTSLKADGRRPHRELLSSNNQNSRKRASKRKRALATKETLTTPQRSPSNGRSTSGPARKNLINEY